MQILGCIQCEGILYFSFLLCLHLFHGCIWGENQQIHVFCFFHICADLSMTLERKSAAAISQLINCAGIKHKLKCNRVREEGKGGVESLSERQRPNKCGELQVIGCIMKQAGTWIVSNDGLWFGKTSAARAIHPLCVSSLLILIPCLMLVLLSSKNLLFCRLYSSFSLVTF